MMIPATWRILAPRPTENWGTDMAKPGIVDFIRAKRPVSAVLASMFCWTAILVAGSRPASATLLEYQVSSAVLGLNDTFYIDQNGAGGSWSQFAAGNSLFANLPVTLANGTTVMGQVQFYN